MFKVKLLPQFQKKKNASPNFSFSYTASNCLKFYFLFNLKTKCDLILFYCIFWWQFRVSLESLDNGLTPSSQQAIIWTNDDQVL